MGLHSQAGPKTTVEKLLTESYAEALTEYPSPGLERDNSSGDANPEKSLNNGKLSSQEEDTMNIEPNKVKTTCMPQPTRPQKQIRKRKKFAKEEQLEV